MPLQLSLEICENICHLRAIASFIGAGVVDTDGTFTLTAGVNNTSGLISHEIYIDWFDLTVNLPLVSKTLLVNDTVVTSDNSIRFAAR